MVLINCVRSCQPEVGSGGVWVHGGAGRRFCGPHSLLPPGPAGLGHCAHGSGSVDTLLVALGLGDPFSEVIGTADWGGGGARPWSCTVVGVRPRNGLVSSEQLEFGQGGPRGRNLPKGATTDEARAGAAWGQVGVSPGEMGLPPRKVCVGPRTDSVLCARWPGAEREVGAGWRPRGSRLGRGGGAVWGGTQWCPELRGSVAPHGGPLVPKRSVGGF